jgi:hypothetical protein
MIDLDFTALEAAEMTLVAARTALTAAVRARGYACKGTDVDFDAVLRKWKIFIKLEGREWECAYGERLTTACLSAGFKIEALPDLSGIGAWFDLDQSRFDKQPDHAATMSSDDAGGVPDVALAPSDGKAEPVAVSSAG